MSPALADPRAATENAFPATGSPRDQIRFLLQYAVLAPSTRNTQPWRFVPQPDGLLLLADLTRWQPVADRLRRELYLSLGCALENFLVAAEHFGFGGRLTLFPSALEPALVADVRLVPGEPRSALRPPALFQAIGARRTEHGPFDDRPVPAEIRRALEGCVERGLRLDLTDDPEIRHRVEELTVRADAIQFADPALRKELADLIGSGTLGTPWLFAHIGRLAVAYLNLGGVFGRRDAEAIRAAPMLGIVSSREDTPAAQVRAGQLLERVWLLATSAGLGLQPISVALQVPETHDELARLLPAGGWAPQQPFRLGFPAHAHAPRSPRRPVDEVMA